MKITEHPADTIIRWARIAAGLYFKLFDGYYRWITSTPEGAAR